MADMASVNVIGRLCSDPDLKRTSSGFSILTMNIACNYKKKSGDQYVDEVSFFNATYLGKGAEAVHPYLKKGDQLGITGELRQDRWEKNGDKQSKVHILVNGITFIGNKNNKDASKQASDNKKKSDEDFEDDIPF